MKALARFATALLAIALLAPSRAGEAAATVAPADVSAALKSIVDQCNVPGLVATAIRGDQVLARGAAGVRLRGAPERVTLGDKFHLGSNTKAMTATIAAMLVEEGQLNWTTTLGQAFGGTVKNMHPAWKNVTLQQVLAHRAGLPGNPDMELGRQILNSKTSLQGQRRILAAGVLSRPPQSPPGTTYFYSNISFILAGAMIEQIADRSWENVARERLFKPLGITSGGFGAPATSLANNQPRGHYADDKPAAPGADNPAYYGPAGTAHMAIGDFAKFVALHLRGDPVNPHAQARLLKPATFAHLHTPAPGENYTGGWQITRRAWAKGNRPGDAGRVITHNGTNTAWYSVTWIAPEIDFAVVVACNHGGPNGAKALDDVASMLIQKFGRPPPKL